VNAKGDANRSVRMTKRRLRDALVELLLQKPVREITVRELTDRAKISRGTFYFHYTDINELMQQIEQEHISQIEQLMVAMLPRIRQDAPPPALEALFEYLDANNDVCKALFGPNGDPAFTQRLKDLLLERCLCTMIPTGGTARQRYLMEFALNGCMGMLLAWQLDDDRPRSQVMTVTVWEALRAVEQILNAPH